MSIKSQNIKNFIKDLGVKTQLFAFAGSDSNSTLSNSAQTTVDIWRNSNFAIKIGQNSIFPVVSNIKWIEKKVYIPWSATENNIGNYYVYNDQNGYVYLCISDNNKNRKDLRGQNVSNIRPSHTVGTQSYSDGYTWKVLYRITPSMERFISSSWIPVVSFDTFDESSQDTLSSQVNNFCDGGASNKIVCAVFAKKPLIESNTLDEYSTGDIYSILEEVTCAECFHMFMNSNDFFTKQYGYVADVPSNYPIETQYNKIKNLINSNEISIASPYYYLYDINSNDELEEGSIVSIFLDLSEFTSTQLKMTKENPEFIITSTSGSGASIKLSTYINFNGSIIVDGILIENNGSNYKDIVLDMNSSYFEDSSIKDLIISAISLNIDKIDGLGFDPIDVLNAEHLMIDVKVEKSQLDDFKISLPNSLNFFGLVANPQEISIGGTIVNSGSNGNKKIDTVYRASSKIALSKVSTNPLPEIGNTVNIEYTKNGNTISSKNAKISGIESSTSTTRNAELSNIQYDIVDDLIGAKVYTSDTEYSNITAIIEKPDFVQYSGSILSTVKTNNLFIDDPETVIIRINMVKGM